MSHCYCATCGHKNPEDVAKCTTCGCEISSVRNNPINADAFRAKPLAIFDIDMTILDSTQRFRDARRAGIVDKDGKAQRKSKLETPGKAYRRRNEFLYSSENLMKDRVIPGALALVENLVARGYTIAYVTARPAQYRDNTLKQLENKGFPVFENMDPSATAERHLLFLKEGSSTAADFKFQKYTKLGATYDLRMVFDDDKDNLMMAHKADVPGIYSSVSEYTKFQSRSNPSYTSYSVEDSPVEPVVSLPNPPLKPRRKKLSNGKYRKEPAKSYVKRFMADRKMNNEFPESGQRYAVALSYVDKFYGKSGLKSIGARQNPGKSTEVKLVPIHSSNITGTKKGSVFSTVQIGRNIFKDIGEGIQDIYRGIVGGRQSLTEKRMAMAIAAMEADLSAQARKLGANAVSNLQIDYEFPSYQGGSSEITVIAHGEAVKTARKNPERYPENYMVAPDIHKLHMAGARLDDQYDEGDEAPEWWKSKLSVTADSADNLADSFEALKDGKIRTNPANPSKIKKAEKLYKHMNGADPEKIEKKKIDIGDVWYQVGEGGCWQIGYMSGKETGSSAQKYTHTFNEETQDGNFPKLYATMPENGKPMLIIMGGTWKIKTDDQGVAWIYD